VIELDADIVRAAALADRATTLNPSCARAWFISGVIRLIEGDGDRATEHLQTAARLDPISPLNDVIRAHIGLGQAIRGQYGEAVRLLRATTHRSARIHLFLAAMYGHLRMPRESQDELAMFHRLSSASVQDMVTTSTTRAELRAVLTDGLALGLEGAGHEPH
jgi:Flp pilus assembly protein TadD